MTGYGMPRGTKGLLPWKWAEDRLRSSHNYYVMTVRPDGTPHAMPVWGIWVEDRFYFSTGAQSRKARNLAANAACVLCTENAAEAVVVEGHASAVTDAARVSALAPSYAREVQVLRARSQAGPDLRSSSPGRLRAPRETFKATTRWTFGH